VNLAIVVYLLAALYVEHFSGVSRGDFTDLFCDLLPVLVLPVALVLLVFGLWYVRAYRYGVSLPALAVLLTLLFRGTVLFWLLGGYVPGR
jgi:hypothetical protein